MNVLDHEPYGFYLLEHDGRLYLEAFCSHSAFDYSVLIAMNRDECAEYAAKGRAFLQGLAYRIHYSAPAVAGSRSPFKCRNLRVIDRQTSERASTAIAEWLLNTAR